MVLSEQFPCFRYQFSFSIEMGFILLVFQEVFLLSSFFFLDFSYGNTKITSCLSLDSETYEF